MGMYADEKSDGCIVPMKPRTRPNEIGCGDGGGTAAGQGEGELRRMLRTQHRNGMSLKQRAHGSELHGYQIPRMPITFDLRQQLVRESRTPGSARGAAGNSRPYRDHGRDRDFAVRRASVLSLWIGADADILSPTCGK